MARNKTNINRLKELEKILDKLKKSSNDDRTDIDLILGYLEKFVNNPADSGGSEKVMGFEIRDDINTMSKIYQLTWRKTDLEQMKQYE